MCVKNKIKRAIGNRFISGMSVKVLSFALVSATAAASFALPRQKALLVCAATDWKEDCRFQGHYFKIDEKHIQWWYDKNNDLLRWFNIAHGKWDFYPGYQGTSSIAARCSKYPPTTLDIIFNTARLDNSNRTIRAYDNQGNIWECKVNNTNWYFCGNPTTCDVNADSQTAPQQIPAAINVNASGTTVFQSQQNNADEDSDWIDEDGGDHYSYYLSMQYCVYETSDKKQYQVVKDILNYDDSNPTFYYRKDGKHIPIDTKESLNGRVIYKNPESNADDIWYPCGQDSFRFYEAYDENGYLRLYSQRRIDKQWFYLDETKLEWFLCCDSSATDQQQQTQEVMDNTVDQAADVQPLQQPQAPANTCDTNAQTQQYVVTSDQTTNEDAISPQQIPAAINVNASGTTVFQSQQNNADEDSDWIDEDGGDHCSYYLSMQYCVYETSDKKQYQVVKDILNYDDSNPTFYYRKDGKHIPIDTKESLNGRVIYKNPESNADDIWYPCGQDSFRFYEAYDENGYLRLYSQRRIDKQWFYLDETKLEWFLCCDSSATDQQQQTQEATGNNTVDVKDLGQSELVILEKETDLLKATHKLEHLPNNLLDVAYLSSAQTATAEADVQNPTTIADDTQNPVSAAVSTKESIVDIDVFSAYISTKENYIKKHPDYKDIRLYKRNGNIYSSFSWYELSTKEKFETLLREVRSLKQKGIIGRRYSSYLDEVNDTNEDTKQGAEKSAEEFIYGYVAGQSTFRNHGIEHCQRTMMNVRVIAEQYKDLFEEFKSITEYEIRLAQIAAIFHDSGRQGDNVDIFDVESGKKAYEFLKSLGVNEIDCEKVRSAIENKDSKVKNKSNIAILLHESDCLELQRIPGPKFDSKFLDCYDKVIQLTLQDKTKSYHDVNKAIEKLTSYSKELISVQRHFTENHDFKKRSEDFAKKADELVKEKWKDNISVRDRIKQDGGFFEKLKEAFSKIS